jgi:hypothetical protein
MNTKSKYTLSLVGVLVIGLILGFLLSGILIRSRVHRLQGYYTEQGFRQEFMRVLRPTPEQMNRIRPVLMNYGRQNRDNMMEYRKRQRALMLDLRHDLQPILTPEQNRHLKALQMRWNQRFFDRRGPGGHGPMHRRGQGSGMGVPE